MSNVYIITISDLTGIGNDSIAEIVNSEAKAKQWINNFQTDDRNQMMIANYRAYPVN